MNTKLIEDHLLPMLVVQDKNSGDIVCQVFNFVEYFKNKQDLTVDNVEKLLRTKGVLEPSTDAPKTADSKKEELDHMLTVGSSYLQEQLNNDEVESLNTFIHEHEKIIELSLEAGRVNYRDILLENFREVQDPFRTEIIDIQYEQNPADSGVVRSIVFKE